MLMEYYEVFLYSIKKLLKIRIFEKKLLELFSEGKINGTTHACIGQEEVAVSVMQNILEDDFFMKQMQNILNEFDKKTINNIPSQQKKNLRF